MFYDERWMEKQERGFVNWLNFILTPPEEHQGSDVKVKVDAGKLTLDIEKGRTRLAPTNEILSFRTYSAHRKLNRLRKSACRLFQSESVRRVIQKVEEEVENKRLLVRKDKMLHADVGAKQKVLDMLLSYNPLWLRMGLETIYGEVVPLQCNTDVYGLSQFIVVRVLASPDTADEYAHPTVPHLYRDGYAEATAQHTLKRFLMLVYFLDQAKQHTLIDHNPCLFCKNSDIKTSKDMLLQFSRDYLSGEGDITRHLGYLGYKVTYSQTALDEFDFAVKSLGTDLRDGLRLVRVMEVICDKAELRKSLRAPAISRLQKIHNLEVVFKTLEQQSIDTGNVTTRDVVDGHREKTLSLLWTIILHYQVAMVINVEQIKEEVQILERSLHLKKQLHKLVNLETDVTSQRRESEGPDLHTQDERLNLLMKWCRAVCAFYDIKVENFTVSFSDGRALCHILHYYHPGLLPLSQINHETSMTHLESMEKNCQQNMNCSLNDSVNSSAVFGDVADPAVYEPLLANEKENFKLLSEKVKELGGIPLMLRWSDMSNTIPDEKVVVTYLMYLCARLLDIRHESRAARVIQHAWRAHRLKKIQAEYEVKGKAVLVIQRAVRRFLQSRRQKRQQSAALCIQKVWRGHQARSEARKLQREKILQQQMHAVRIVQSAVKRYIHRRRYLEMKTAVIQVQAYCRGYLVRRKRHTAATNIQRVYRGHLARQQVKLLQHAAIKIQAAIRGFLARKLLKKQVNAARTIQCRYRACLEMRKQQCVYRTTRKACTVIQKCWRRHLALKREKHEKAAVKIQTCFRCYSDRKRYQKLKDNAVCIQAAFRGCIQRREFERRRKAVLLLQRRFRDYLVTRQQRQTFLKTKEAVLWMQSKRRMIVERKKYLVLSDSATRLQACARMLIQRQKFQKLKSSAVTLQRYYRALSHGRVCRKNFLVSKGAAITIQAAFRGYRVRREVRKCTSAAVVIQSNLRCYIARCRFLALKTAAIVCQQRYRAKISCRNECDNYTKLKSAALVVQKMFRGLKSRRAYTRDRNDIVKVQSVVRMYLGRKQFMKMKKAVNTLQVHYRAYQLGKSCRHQFLVTVGATITLQAGVRGFICQKQYKETRQQIIQTQAAVRGHLQYRRYQNLKQSTILIQKRYRETLVARQQRSNFVEMKKAAIVLQSAWRLRKERSIYLKMKGSVIIVQSVVRRMLQQKRYRKLKSAVQTVEKYFCAKMEGERCRHRSLVCKGAAMTIQAAFRGHKVRKALKERHTSAVTIQACYRGYVERTKFQKLKNAAVYCQRRFRSIELTRKVHGQYAEVRKAVITIQAAYKGYVLRKQYTKIRQSAVKIQTVVRGYLQRQQYQNTRSAVITIQRRMREILLSRQQRRDFLRLKHAAVAAQSIWRMKREQRRFVVCRQAAILIQSRVRGFIQQKKYQRLISAAYTIQKYYRARTVGERCRRQFLLTVGAVISIQAWFRGHQVRKQLKLETKSAIVIQSVFRGYRQRSQYMQLKRAAVVCQRRYKAILIGRKMQGQFECSRKAIIHLQTAVRAWRCRREFLRMKDSVVKIQAFYRMQTARRAYQQQKHAAVTIQQWFRGTLLTNAERRNFLVQRGAAITMQAYARMYIIRKLYLQTMAARKNSAAVRIQACVRRYLAVQKFDRLKSAVVTCQRKYRAKCCGQQDRQYYVELKKSAVTIQSHFRCLQCQRSYKRFKQSAVTIQSWLRGVKVRRIYVQQKNAAIVLQTRWRAELLCRQYVMQYHQLRDATISIQSIYRGKIARNSQRRLKAAVKIQAVFRMMRQRKDYYRMKMASLTIQSAVRSWQAKKRLECLRTERCRLNAAITIQSGIRAWQARKQLDFLKEKKLQIRKQYLDRYTEVARANMSAIVIQRCFRNHKMMRLARERLQSILLIQRWMRSKLQRLHYIRDRQHVIHIQSRVRTWLARRDRAARVIQRVARQWLATADTRKQHAAAVKIQALWKGYHKRKSIKSRRLTLLRKRVQETSASATEENKLGNRTSSALDFLLRYKQLSQVLDALQHLEVASRLSWICCERMVEAIPVLYRLVQGCNRSLPHMEIIKYTISILTNLSKYEKTRPAVYEAEGGVNILVNLMQIYREKGQIFSRTCTLLGILALETPCKMSILEDVKLVERLRSIQMLTSRKHKLEVNQRVTRARMNASSLNATFMVRSPVKRQKIKPDWSLHKDKMNEIENPLKAINFVLGNLGIQANSR